MKRFTKILCTLGIGDTHDRLLERAVDLALKHQAELTVANVVEPVPAGWQVLTKQHNAGRRFEAERMQRLESAVSPYRTRLNIDTHVVIGKPFLSIIREVLSSGYDLVIRESEDPDWLERVLGSDDMQLLRHCPCPVWLVDPSAPLHCQRLLAAVDVDQQYPADELETRHTLNRRILDLACSIAIAESAELHVVDVWESLSASYAGIGRKLSTEYNERTKNEHASALASLLHETMAAISPEASNRIELSEHLVAGYPRRQIPDLAEQIEADLVVMGSVARIGVPGLFVGNTAESVLSQIQCSVLVVKPPGFISPVGSYGDK